MRSTISEWDWHGPEIAGFCSYTSQFSSFSSFILTKCFWFPDTSVKSRASAIAAISRSARARGFPWTINNSTHRDGGDKLLWLWYWGKLFYQERRRYFFQDIGDDIRVKEIHLCRPLPMPAARKGRLRFLRLHQNFSSLYLEKKSPMNSLIQSNCDCDQHWKKKSMPFD